MNPQNIAKMKNHMALSPQMAPKMIIVLHHKPLVIYTNRIFDLPILIFYIYSIKEWVWFERENEEEN